MADSGKSIFDFSVDGSDRKPYDLSQHKGKVVLVMNTASKCGYTQSGYTTATELYNKYKDQGFTVLGFPCNQFGSQEPGTEEEIVDFVCKRFKADFPMMAKVDVNGGNAHPLWEYMKATKPGILGTKSIKWNFTMFLINKAGVPVARYSPGTKTEEIEKLLVPLLQEGSA